MRQLLLSIFALLSSAFVSEAFAGCPCNPCCHHARHSHHRIASKIVVIEKIIVKTVVVHEPAVVAAPAPAVVESAPLKKPCLPKEVVLAARTDDGYVNHQPGSAPPTAHPCTKLINGQVVQGHCW